MGFLAGKMLLATPQLTDPNFARAAVLVARHDDDGAMGFVLNKPLPMTLGDALADPIESAQGVTAKLFAGGPCAGPLFVLHGMAHLGGDVIAGPFAPDAPIAGPLRFSAEREVIESLLRDDPLPGRSRFFVSYAGWAVGQLEAEVAEGAWVGVEVTPTDVFSDPATLWSRLHARRTLSPWLTPEKIPDDPTVN